MDEINPAAEVREAECSLNDLRDQIKDHYGHYQRHQGHALESLRKVGALIIRARNRLPHGAFSTWVEKNLDFGPRQARNYMRLAEQWTKIKPEVETSALNLDQAMQILVEDAKDEEVAPTKPVPFSGGTSAPTAPAKPVQKEPGEGAHDEMQERIFKALCKRCQRIGTPGCDKCRVKAYRIQQGLEAHAKGTGPKAPAKRSNNGQAVFDWAGVFDAIKVIAQAPDKLRHAYGDCPQIIALDRLHKEYEEKRVKLLQDLQKKFT